MKKTLNTLLAGFLLLMSFSCENSSKTITSGQATEMLQKIYPVVYKIYTYSDYITVDSVGQVFHIVVARDGQIESRIRIK